MRKKLEPRFPESLQRLKDAIRDYGNNAQLARLSGVSVATIANLSKENNSTSFPWHQTVEALWQVLPAPEVVPARKLSTIEQVNKRHSPSSQIAERRPRRYGKSRHMRASMCRITRPVRVQIGEPF